METEIFDLEKKYWRGMENHDYETVKSLTRLPCIVAGKNGVHNVDEANFKKIFEAGDGDKIKVLHFSNVEAQSIGENAVVIAYLIELGIDGKQDEVMKCACASTWIKENEKWVCALHTESELSKQ
jgi:uncharacterized protein DUF4440